MPLHALAWASIVGLRHKDVTIPSVGIPSRVANGGGRENSRKHESEAHHFAGFDKILSRTR